MSSATGQTFDDDGQWQPSLTFREHLADTEGLAGVLLDRLRAEQALLVPVAEVEFLARRLHHLARQAHRALPPEVE